MNVVSLGGHGKRSIALMIGNLTALREAGILQRSVRMYFSGSAVVVYGFIISAIHRIAMEHFTSFARPDGYRRAWKALTTLPMRADFEYWESMVTQPLIAFLQTHHQREWFLARMMSPTTWTSSWQKFAEQRFTRKLLAGVDLSAFAVACSPVTSSSDSLTLPLFVVSGEQRCVVGGSYRTVLVNSPTSDTLFPGGSYRRTRVLLFPAPRASQGVSPESSFNSRDFDEERAYLMPPPPPPPPPPPTIPPPPTQSSYNEEGVPVPEQQTTHAEALRVEVSATMIDATMPTIPPSPPGGENADEQGGHAAPPPSSPGENSDGQGVYAAPPPPNPSDQDASLPPVPPPSGDELVASANPCTTSESMRDVDLSKVEWDEKKEREPDFVPNVMTPLMLEEGRLPPPPPPPRNEQPISRPPPLSDLSKPDTPRYTPHGHKEMCVAPPSEQIASSATTSMTLGATGSCRPPRLVIPPSPSEGVDAICVGAAVPIDGTRSSGTTPPIVRGFDIRENHEEMDTKYTTPPLLFLPKRKVVSVKLTQQQFYQTMSSMLLPNNLQSTPSAFGSKKNHWDLHSSAGTDPLNMDLVSRSFEAEICASSATEVYLVNAYTNASMFDNAHAALQHIPFAMHRYVHYFPLFISAHPGANAGRQQFRHIVDHESVAWDSADEYWLPLTMQTINELMAHAVMFSRQDTEIRPCRRNKRKNPCVSINEPARGAGF